MPNAVAALAAAGGRLAPEVAETRANELVAMLTRLGLGRRSARFGRRALCWMPVCRLQPALRTKVCGAWGKYLHTCQRQQPSYQRLACGAFAIEAAARAEQRQRAGRVQAAVAGEEA